MNCVTNLIIIAVVATVVVLYLRSTHFTLRRSEQEVMRIMLDGLRAAKRRRELQWALDGFRRAKRRRELQWAWKDWITLHGYDLATYNRPAAWQDLLRNDPDAETSRGWLTIIGFRWEQLRRRS